MMMVKEEGEVCCVRFAEERRAAAKSRACGRALPHEISAARRAWPKKFPPPRDSCKLVEPWTSAVASTGKCLTFSYIST